MEVLTRGPVHEAFAETVTYNPEPGVVAPKAPPAAIEEVPPAERPEGDNVAWIPGYWGWDEERNDFLWVSGVWRALPPGRQWVPGYWAKSGQGSQWTSGYWADAQTREVQYLAAPPATVESGPNVAATSEDQTWLPGSWVWQENRYAWRPGFWATVQPDWVWVPAHYVWTPRGCIFVEGYWDYAIGRRGVLFAPVYFGAGVYGRPGFSYSPAMVIDLGVFSNYLFMRPRYHHYYFGDYYATSYFSAGFYPWFSINIGRFGYDPFYAHDRWRHRGDRGWEQLQRTDFQRRRDHENLRPPRTWDAQRAMGSRPVQGGARMPLVAMPLADFSKSKGTTQRFQAVNQSERKQLGQRGQEVQRFGQQRQKLESTPLGAPADARVKGFTPTKTQLPGSPIMAKPVAGLGKDRVPPKTFEGPKSGVNVAPQPKATQLPGQPRTQPQTKVGQPVPQLQPKVERPTPQPQPKVERPTPQPQPKVERPTPQPQPKVERPTPQPQPKVERPTPQPQPKVERPTPQPQPKVERPTPQPQPKVERPTPQPQPKVERPAPQPQPKVERPAPQPQPRVERPAPQPQPRVERPAPQPQPRVERPAPQPQPRVERPAPQPQPRVERPAPQPQPRAPAGPPAGAKQDNPKDKK